MLFRVQVGRDVTKHMYLCTLCTWVHQFAMLSICPLTRASAHPDSAQDLHFLGFNVEVDLGCLYLAHANQCRPKNQTVEQLYGGTSFVYIETSDDLT
jgi:hypothetical protein